MEKKQLTDDSHAEMDEAIMKTSDDAIRAKVAAVQAGYYEDPFVEILSRGKTQQYHVQPLIKRGTHARVAVMDRAIASFLRLCQSTTTDDTSLPQVVVLGAGKDSTFFRLIAGQLTTPTADPVSIKWFEIDHAEIVHEKVKIVTEASQFGAKVTKPMEGKDVCVFESAFEGVWKATPLSSLTLVAHDLRALKGLEKKLGHGGFSSDSPTLFLMECFQMYLPEPSDQSLLRKLFGLNPNNCYIAIYEPILGNDPFGKIMEANLTRVGVANPQSCLNKTRTLQQHMSKLAAAGFEIATACDMWNAFQTILTAEQRQRATTCELVDEVEDFVLIMKHYCFAVASARKARYGAEFCEIGDKSLLGFRIGLCSHNSLSTDEGFRG